MGAIDDGTLSDAQWFAKHGKKKEQMKELRAVQPLSRHIKPIPNLP